MDKLTNIINTTIITKQIIKVSKPYTSLFSEGETVYVSFCPSDCVYFDRKGRIYNQHKGIIIKADDDDYTIEIDNTNIINLSDYAEKNPSIFLTSNNTFVDIKYNEQTKEFRYTPSGKTSSPITVSKENFLMYCDENKVETKTEYTDDDGDKSYKSGTACFIPNKNSGLAVSNGGLAVLENEKLRVYT